QPDGALARPGLPAPAGELFLVDIEHRERSGPVTLLGACQNGERAATGAIADEPFLATEQIAFRVGPRPGLARQKIGAMRTLRQREREGLPFANDVRCSHL